MTKPRQRPMRVGLAPMEGVSDFPARVWFYLLSKPDFLSTPFLRLYENFPKNEIPPDWCPEILVPELAEILPYQCIPQLMSAEPSFFIATARKMLGQTAFVDLNCGCPAPKAVGKGAGSSLIAETARFKAFISEITAEIGAAQLSVKMRVGYHNTDLYTELVEVVNDAKILRLSVHGRTRDQAYLGLADWSLIGRAAARLAMPVIGSGDVQDCSSLQERLLMATKVSEVIVGRGALRNPWVFEELKNNQVRPVGLKVLPLALATFAVINHKFLFDFPALCLAIRRVFAAEHPEDEVERWQSIFGVLISSLYKRNLQPEGIEIDTRSLGRLKLHWGYMRTSLPHIFFHPPLMRAKSLRDFLGGLNDLNAAYYLESGFGHVYPQVNHSHDWMFSGERRR